MSKLGLLAAGAAGYVLGTRAGREQYAKIKEQAQSLWSNPKVQDAKTQATEAVSNAASSAKAQVREAKTDTDSPAGPSSDMGVNPLADERMVEDLYPVSVEPTIENAPMPDSTNPVTGDRA